MQNTQTCKWAGKCKSIFQKASSKSIWSYYLVSSEYVLKLSWKVNDAFGRYYSQDTFYQNNLISDFKSVLHNKNKKSLAVIWGNINNLRSVMNKHTVDTVTNKIK